MQTAAQEVLAQGLNVRQTEALVKRMLAGPKPKEEKPDAIYVKALEERLTRQTGRRVRLVSGPKKGKLEIEYYGNEDLDALLAALGLAAAE